MSERRLALLGAVIALGVAGTADSFTVAFEGFEPSGDEWVGCGLEVQGSTLLIVVDPPEQPGLAVFGGPSDLLIDGNESVRVEFVDGSATGVRYTVSAIAFGGGASIEAFDATGGSLGSVEVSGTGEKNVSALFGHEPLSAFRVMPQVGGHRIGSLVYRPPGGLITVRMGSATDTQTPSLQHCGLGVSGSGDLHVSPVTGIGVGGVGPGVLDDFVEVGESLTVEFDGPVFQLSYAQTWSGASPPRVELTGFGETGAPLGETIIESAGPVDVSAQFGGAPLTGFALAPLEGDLSLLDVRFVPEPGAAAAALGAFAGLAARRRTWWTG